MSAARVLDDLARALAEPMPRRRALKLLGGSLASVAVPGWRPALAAAGAARAQEACETARLCPGQGLCGFTIDADQTGKTKACIFGCCIKNGEKKVCCKYRPPGEMPFAWCCDPGEACGDPVEDGAKLCKPKPCPSGKPRCGSKCCTTGQTCKKGQCCPNSRVCGDNCCPAGKKCAFSGQRRVCCPAGRVVSRKIRGTTTRFCCPSGTVSVTGDSCCPPGDRECCDELVPLDPGGGDPDLVPLNPYVGRVFCVRGKPKKL